MTERTLTCPELADKLTVEALVDCRHGAPEAMQVLVSKWRPPDRFDRFAAHDAGCTDGLDSTGYFGAVFDGRYVYFSPEMHGDSSTHGVVLRYDTHADFGSPASYAAHDASVTDGLDTRGFYGAVFDGRYVYFVPRQIGLMEYHSRVLRLDTNREFADPSSWSAFDVGEQHSQQSAAFDGRYIYFCPGFDGDPATEENCSGRVIRFDTAADFKSKSSYTSIDIREWLGPDATCFDGGAFDGRYIYFIPLSSGRVVRYDTRGGFDHQSSWQSFDARVAGMGMNVGAVFDGRHLYFCAYGHARIVRFDTAGEFADPKCWASHDAGGTDGLATSGFDGGYFDGRFVYFQPFFLDAGEEDAGEEDAGEEDAGEEDAGEEGRRDVRFHSHYLRYDPTRAFGDSSSWQARDASATDGLHSVGYNGGAFDGRYFYAAPWQQGPRSDGSGQFITHGVVLRCDTLGDCGSFSLRYCDYGHNGGLNAAVPGPSFLVNTERGVVSVASHRALPAGRHHLAGTYDGAMIELFIDGEIAARREGHGRIVCCDEPVVLGGIRDGLGRFCGDVVEATIRNSVDGEFELLRRSKA